MRAVNDGGPGDPSAQVSATTVDVGGTSDRVHDPGYPGQWLYFQVRAVRAPGAETTYSDWSETVPYWYQ